MPCHCQNHARIHQIKLTVWQGKVIGDDGDGARVKVEAVHLIP